MNLEQILNTYPSYCPLPGRCIVKLDAPASLTPGGIIVPDIAKDFKLRNNGYMARGTVIKLSSRDSTPELFKEGDSVYVSLRSEDMDKSYISTHNTRIEAISEK